MLKDSSQESSRNLHRTTRTASKATILVALLFLSPLLAGIPVATDEENPMQSSTRQMGPDVVVTDLDVSCLISSGQGEGAREVAYRLNDQ